jgi:16S rRNA (cytidine1402-2'-O)-methyltransferase
MLSFIPTPIGNREDITVRALRLLKECTVLFCEDTRTTKNLCRMYEIQYSDKKLIPYTSYVKNI